MSTRSIRQALIVMFSVSISGIAFARNPPALVRQQAAVTAESPESAGYRDINWRFGDIAGRAPEVMGTAGGYRDIHHRFARASQQPTQAAATLTTPRWR